MGRTGFLYLGGEEIPGWIGFLRLAGSLSGGLAAQTRDRRLSQWLSPITTGASIPYLGG